MKKCSICKKRKRLSDFNFKSKSEDQHQPHCRACSKERMRIYYRLNRKKHLATVRERHKRVVEFLREKVLAYLKTHGCVDCPENDPVVLEFDHVRGKKFKEISLMIRHGHSWRAIEAEIAKCDVRCSNCHRRRTYKKLKSWRCAGCRFDSDRSYHSSLVQ